MKSAFKNIEKTELINADEAIEKTNYYCLNPNCKAILRACALKHDEKIRIKAPYFAALIVEHDDNCIYKDKYIDITKYDCNNFDLNLFFSALSSKETQTNNHANNNLDKNYSQNKTSLPNSLLEVYKSCINSSLEDELSGQKIINILADIRSEYLYTKFISGNKIVEGKLIYIDTENSILTFQYPAHLNKEKNKKYLYLKAKINYSTNLKNSFPYNSIYIIGGFFNNNKVEIFSSKQIKYLKK